MTTDFTKIREVLKGRETEIVTSIGDLHVDLHQRDDHVGDSIDKSVAQVDHASASALREREVVTLHEIRNAISRIDEGLYGACEECEEPIPVGRLEVNPLAVLCIQCAEEAEMDASRKPSVKRSFFDT